MPGYTNLPGGSSIGGPEGGGSDGSVLFVHPASIVAQDNSNFYFASHLLSVTAAGDTTGTDSVNVYNMYDAYNPNSAVGSVFTATTVPGMSASTSQGTGIAPTLSLTGDIIGGFSFWPYSGASAAFNNHAGMFGVVRGVTANNLGGELQFYTKIDNGVLTKAVVIANDQGLGITSASANSFAVGLTGTTNPSFQVDSSTGSQASGIKITGGTAAGIVALAVISSGTNTDLSIDTKGSGQIRIQASGTGNIIIGSNGGSPAVRTIQGWIASGSSIGGSSLTIAASAGTGAGSAGVLNLQTTLAKQASAATAHTLTTVLVLGNAQSAHPGTAGGIINATAATWTDANTANSGTAATAVSYAFQQPTLAAANTSVVTTDAATVYIANSPTNGTNMTITRAHALWVAAGDSRFDGAITQAYIAKTALYTATASDRVIDCTSGTFNLTLPTAVGIQGRIYTIKNSGSGVITVNTTSAQTIDGASTKALNQFQSLDVVSNNANWIVT